MFLLGAFALSSALSLVSAIIVRSGKRYLYIPVKGHIVVQQLANMPRLSRS